MEALILLTQDDCLILLENGGIASGHYNGDYFLLEMYQERLTKPVNSIWEEVEDFKMYVKEFPLDESLTDEILGYALNWLSPVEAVHKTIFKSVEFMRNEDINQFLFNKKQ